MGRMLPVTPPTSFERPKPATSSASQSGSTIYVLKPDAKVELRSVKVTRTAGDSALIATGISAGETVVTDGQLKLQDGVPVVGGQRFERASLEERLATDGLVPFAGQDGGAVHGGDDAVDDFARAQAGATGHDHCRNCHAAAVASV